MSRSFVQELKRRNVFRVAAIYVIVSWLLMQIGDVMFPALLLPGWTTTMLVAFLLLGFPLAMIFAWAYEITPDGVLRTEDVPEEHSITTDTGQKINRLIITVLAAAVVVLLVRTLLDNADTAPAPSAHNPSQSIAILPFKNQSVSAENAEFFADGLHDELLTLLTKLGELRVISRTSVERLDPDLSIPEIGKLLGVATVLEGQVQRAGDRLRINVQLIDTSAEGHLWANTYDRELTAENIFDVQSDIARTISSSLQAELSASDEALLSEVPTTNTEALERYLLGKQLWERSSFAALRSASDYFLEATELDPDFAQAWAAFAGVQTVSLQTGAIDLQSYRKSVDRAIGRALALNDKLSEAHAELGNLRWQTGDLDGAEAAYKIALSLNPTLPHSLLTYGTYLRSTNRAAEAVPVLEKALANDPLSPLILFDLGKAEMFLGNSDKTLDYAARILEIDPSSVYGYGGNLQAHLDKGRFDQSLPWMIRMISVDPVDFENWAYMGLWSAMLGMPEVSRRYLEHALELGPNEPAVLKCKIQVLHIQGKYAEATAEAYRAIEAKLDDRWYSQRVFLRQIRDAALAGGDLQESLGRYQNYHPELFLAAPEFTLDNINAAADLALLLRELGESAQAKTLIDSGLDWYHETRPVGVYGYENGIVVAEFLALRGDTDAAVGILSDAVDYGWVYAWPWYLASPNLDSIRYDTKFQAIVNKLENIMNTQRDAYLALPNMGEFDLR